jgi:taurine transport system permease protein
MSQTSALDTIASGSKPKPRKRLSHYWRARAISVSAVVLVLLIWELSGVFAWIDPILLPPPTQVLEGTVELLRTGYRNVPLWQHIWVSVARGTVACSAAVVVGIPVGLSMGLYSDFRAALDPFVQFLRPIPKLAFIPLVIVWFGIGEGSKFFLIFLSCVLGVLASASAAVASVSEGRIRAAQVLGASRRQIIFRVVLPNALPELFTGIRLSVGIGWTALVAAEMVAANSGLGFMVINAGDYLRTDIVMLGILLLGIIGYSFDFFILTMQRIMVPWAGKDG